MIYVQVAINLPIKNLFKQFLYSVPPELGQVQVGWRVFVPFAGQRLEGFVVQVVPEEQVGSVYSGKVKEVLATFGTEPWFNREMLATAKWLSDYYMCSLADAMRLFIPGKSSIKKEAVYNPFGRLIAYKYKERLTAKTVLAYEITPLGQQALEEGSKRQPAQMAALEYLAGQREPVTVNEAAAKQVSGATLRTLAEKGWALRRDKRLLRNSYAADLERTENLQLTDQQLLAVEALKESLGTATSQVEGLQEGLGAGTSELEGLQESLGSGTSEVEALKESLGSGTSEVETLNYNKTFLLQGITGSGKTEVYLRATEAALAQGKQVLVLVPEIALTAQIVRRFQAWFKDQVVVVHSKLSQNERGDVWYQMRTGEAGVLIGVRSAVFAPFKKLGLVIIDEEHENSYKQEERPSYNAKAVAAKRCASTGATLLLGSATPSLETYALALEGRIRHLRLTKRPTGALLPQVTIVDMRAELEAKNFSVISNKLRRELISTAASGEQAIVLLNRRGYSTFVSCRDCGEALMCPHCAVSLVYHAAENVMRCHYCGNVYPIPTECPSCHSKRIKFFGSGTQKAEAEIGKMPGIRILRMDQDSTAAKLAHEELINKFAAGQANVLLGTQMVAKGHDIANVTLVGLLAADSTLNLPDFRASERAFALLTQAAGRAGRGSKPGHVVLQTYDPENQVIRLAAQQNYEAFAKGELEARRELFYPPYSEILKITIIDKEEAAALRLADELTSFLREAAGLAPLRAGVAVSEAAAEEAWNLFEQEYGDEPEELEAIDESFGALEDSLGVEGNGLGHDAANGVENGSPIGLAKGSGNGAIGASLSGGLGAGLGAFGQAKAKTQIMGPFPAGVAKVRDLYRMNIVIKSNELAGLKKAISQSRYLELKNVYFDVDPISVI